MPTAFGQARRWETKRKEIERREQHNLKLLAAHRRAIGLKIFTAIGVCAAMVAALAIAILTR